MNESPIVRVEFEYADGSIKRLTGEIAEKWLKEVNNVCILTQVRTGVHPISEYEWEQVNVKTESDDLSR